MLKIFVDNSLQTVRPFMRASFAFAAALYRSNRYRVIFATYILTVTWTCACVMYLIQRHTSSPATVLQTWFIAVSCFTSAGLGIVDVTQWHPATQVVMIVAMQCGSLVLCSALPSVLRLRALWNIDCSTLQSSDAAVVRRHYNVNSVIIWTCVAYWLSIQLVSVFVMAILCGHSFWWSIFHTSSGFTNAGFSLDVRSFAIPELIDNTLLVCWFIIIVPIGFSLYPVCQRPCVKMWRALAKHCAAKKEAQRATTTAVVVMPTSGRKWFLLNLTWREFSEGLDELLGCPNLYFTHLFSSKNTWILLGLWLAITTTDFVMFTPDYGGSAFVSTHHEWLQAVFQSAATGLTMMDFSQLRLGHLLFWVASMYLNTYPFIVIDKSTQISAEARAQQDAQRSEVKHDAIDVVGIDGASTKTTPDDGPSMAPRHALLRSLMGDGEWNAWELLAKSKGSIDTIKKNAQTTAAAEMGWLFLACVVIAYMEGGSLTEEGSTDSDPMLRLLFEVSSAYGTVGLSLSSAQAPTLSYCAIWSPLSQLLVILLMCCGKSRGLPQEVSIHWVARMVESRRLAPPPSSGRGELELDHIAASTETTKQISSPPSASAVCGISCSSLGSCTLSSNGCVTPEAVPVEPVCAAAAVESTEACTVQPAL